LKRTVAALVTLGAALLSGCAASAGVSLARSGVKAFTFKDEGLEMEVTDRAEVSSRVEMAEMSGVYGFGPLAFRLGYGLGLADVRYRRVDGPTTGESHFLDRATLAVEVGTSPPFVAGVYALGSAAAITSMLDAGSYPLWSLEGGVQLGIYDHEGRGAFLRVGVFQEKGKVERFIPSENLSFTLRGDYRARGLAATIGFAIRVFDGGVF